MIISKRVSSSFVLTLLTIAGLLSGCNPMSTMSTEATSTDLLESITILRPLDKEVIPLSNTSISITYKSEVGGSIPFSISVADSNNVLQSGIIKVSSGINQLSLALEQSVLFYRGGFLNLTIGSETLEFGRGLVFLVAGQSNTADAQCVECMEKNIRYPTDPRVVHLVNNQFIQPKNGSLHSEIDISGDLPTVSVVSRDSFQFAPLSDSSPMIHGIGRNVWNRVGRNLADKFNVPVAFVIIGKGGTSSSEWMTSEFLNRFDYGVGFEFSAVLWHQGEADAILAVNKSTYISNMRSIMQSVYSKGIKAPWIIARASVCGHQILPINEKQKEIEEAQLQLASEGAVGGVLQNVLAGPNTNLISHACHFDSVAEFDAYTQAWTENLLKHQSPDFSPQVIGYIDRITSEGKIQGWACDRSIPQSIDIHVYIGGPAGQGGVFIASYSANQVSEAQVASACRVASGNYRFSFTLPTYVKEAYSNKQIYIYGISKSNGANKEILGSSVIRVPAKGVY